MITIGLLACAIVGTIAEARHQGLSSGRSPSSLARSNRFPPVGSCEVTRVKLIANRNDITRDGTVMTFTNGLVQISYDIVPQIFRSRPGDKVTNCVVSLPQNCPPGDTRGIYYRTRNWRTGEHWTLPDSQHECGGA